MEGFESIRLSDTGALSADSLLALDAATSAVIDVASISALTGPAAQILSVYSSAGIEGLSDKPVIVSGITAADSVNAIRMPNHSHRY